MFNTNPFIVVDKTGSASTSNSACCGCFRRGNRETLLEMYSVNVTKGPSHNKRCFDKTRIGPPDHDCFLNEKSPKKNQAKTLTKENANFSDYELADDAISLDKKYLNKWYTNPNNRLVTKDECLSYTPVNGKEELPCIHKYYIKHRTVKDGTKKSDNNCRVVCADKCSINKDRINKNVTNYASVKEIYGYCTLPKYKKQKYNNSRDYLKCMTLPKRITPDGTHIYYWCDIKKPENGGKCNLFTFRIEYKVGKYYNYASAYVNGSSGSFRRWCCCGGLNREQLLSNR